MQSVALPLDARYRPGNMSAQSAKFLLIGPYDPHCGEYTFLAPPLGVWRLAGVLNAAGVATQVFDPNCCVGSPQRALERELLREPWDLIGISTTGMTLRFDLELAHIARRLAPSALIVAGGMEATFRPELMFELGPFDLVVLGEGERPLLELAERLRARRAPDAASPAWPSALADGKVSRYPQPALIAARAARRDLQHPLRADAVSQLLGAARERLPGRGAADQSGARSARSPRSARCA